MESCAAAVLRMVKNQSGEEGLLPSSIFSIAGHVVSLVIECQGAPSAAGNVEKQLQSLLEESADFSQPQTVCGLCVSAVAWMQLKSAPFNRTDEKIEGMLNTLLQTLLARPSVAEVQLASLCVARLYPIACSAIVDACLDSIVTVDETNAIPLLVSIDILSLIVEQYRSDVGAPNITQGEQVGPTAPLEPQPPSICLRVLERGLQSIKLLHRDPSVIPLIIRKLVVASLLERTGTAAPMYRDRIQTVLFELGSTEDSMAEGIVLAAALFDHLFPNPAQSPYSAGTQMDLRKNVTFWNIIINSLKRGTKFNEDPSKKTTLQNQTIYLMKRIVDQMQEQYQKPNQKKGGAQPKEGSRKHRDPATQSAAASNPAPKEEVIFEPGCFAWSSSYSSAFWENFFLLFDTFTEYSPHLIIPTASKLRDLCERASSGWRSPDTGKSPNSPWVEILLTKLLLHGNVAVRKFALDFLWTLPTDIILNCTFTQDFLYGIVLVASTDPKICTEVDRAVLPGTFLDCKAFGGKDEDSLPSVQPVVLRGSTFYSKMMLAELKQGKEHLQTVLLRFLDSLHQERFSRFPLTAMSRIFYEIALTIAQPIATVPLLESILFVVREGIHDKHPQWLEARLLALTLDTTFALIHGDADMFQTSTFANLLSALGKGGSSGGKSMAAFDSSGLVGTSGSCLNREAFYDRLRYYANKFPAFAALSQTHKTAVDLLSQRKALFPAQAKTSTVLLPLCQDAFLPSRSGQRSGTSWAPEGLSEELLTLPTRASMTAEVRYGTLLLFAECGECSDNRLWFPEPTLRSVWETLRGIYNSSTTATVANLLGKHTLVDVSDLQREEWHSHTTDRADILCAATSRCLQQLLYYHKANLSYGVKELALCETVVQVVKQASELSRMQTGSVAGEYLRIVTLRNCARFLQSIMTLIALGDAASTTIFTPTTAMELISSLMEWPSLHLTVSSTPCSLSTESWGVIIGQAYRAQWNTIYALCDALLNVEKSRLSPEVSESFLKKLLRQTEDEMDRCSPTNLCCLVDVACWLIPYLTLDECESLTRGVHRHCDTTIKREHLRVSASYLLSMVARPSLEELPNAAFEIADALLSDLEECETTERILYMISVGFSRSELAHSWEHIGGADSRVTPLLKRIAIFSLTSFQDDENEGCLAVVEPAVMDWPASLRKNHLPTLRMSAVARSLAISTLLYRAHRQPAFALQLALELLDMNFSDPVVSHEPTMPNSMNHRCRIHVWQILLSLASTIPSEDWPQLIDPCVRALTITNLGSVRRYMELFLTKALWVRPDLSDCVLVYLKDHATKAQVAGSFASVSFQLLFEKGFDGSPTATRLLKSLFPVLFRFCASQQHLLRLVCQIGVHALITQAKKSQTPVAGLLLTPEVEEMYSFFETALECIKAREKSKSIVLFDAHFCMTPRDIFCVQRKESDFWLMESVPAAVFERVRFVASELMSAVGAVTPFESHRCRQLSDRLTLTKLFAVFSDLPLIPHSPNHYDTFLDYTQELSPNPPYSSTSGNQSTKDATSTLEEAMQRKVQSWWTSEVHNELHPRALGIRQRQSVIVVTTLLENPVNVAGLCRCAEIWTVEKVVVSDRKVFSHPYFVAVARSAELWTPFEVVPEDNLLTYLRQKRLDGYTIVGVEQTSNSQSLPEYKFPDRVVIVLGSEGQGMPAPFIPVMDTCVEIPQYGLIRSLNVHVSGAVALYEYTRQHRMVRPEAK